VFRPLCSLEMLNKRVSVCTNSKSKPHPNATRHFRDMYSDRRGRSCHMAVAVIFLAYKAQSLTTFWKQKAGKPMQNISCRPQYRFWRTMNAGGWQAKASLGQALFMEPDILLLDEPTNALDVEGIIFLQVERDRYLLLSTHISLWEHSSHFRLIGRGVPSVSCYC